MVRAVGIEPTLLSEPDFEVLHPCYDALRHTAMECDKWLYLSILKLVIIIPLYDGLRPSFRPSGSYVAPGIWDFEAQNDDAQTHEEDHRRRRPGSA